MFSGIIESTQKIEKVTQGQGALSVLISRPSDFTDLKVGDSIAVDGICLTLEESSTPEMKFTLGAETLKVMSALKNSSLDELEQKLWQKKVNLERSLKWGDRIHGHLVSGHVEEQGTVIKSEAFGESWILEVLCSKNLEPFILKKGSIAINGVSLTVNHFENLTLQVCLIPETLKKTNLGSLRPDDSVNIETDLNIKSLFKVLDNEMLIQKISAHVQMKSGGLL